MAIYRELAAANPARYRPDLAQCPNSLHHFTIGLMVKLKPIRYGLKPPHRQTLQFDPCLLSIPAIVYPSFRGEGRRGGEYSAIVVVGMSSSSVGTGKC